MNRRDKGNDEIERLFEAERKADRATAPSFSMMLSANRATRTVRSRSGWLAAVALAAGAATLLLAWVAVRLTRPVEPATAVAESTVRPQSEPAERPSLAPVNVEEADRPPGPAGAVEPSQPQRKLEVEQPEPPTPAAPDSPAPVERSGAGAPAHAEPPTRVEPPAMTAAVPHGAPERAEQSGTPTATPPEAHARPVPVAPPPPPPGRVPGQTSPLVTTRPSQGPTTDQELADKLRALGYVADERKSSIDALEASPARPTSPEVDAEESFDLLELERLVQQHVETENDARRTADESSRLLRGLRDQDGDGNPNVHGSRSRKLPQVIGVANVDPLTGQSSARINPNSIEELGTIVSPVSAKSVPALYGLTVLQKQGDSSEADPGFNTESYELIQENGFLSVADNPLSTFSIDVDTASYAKVRRFLTEGRLPPKNAVRIEELLNYFDYDYPPADGEDPFSVHVEVAGCPWNPDHRLARIGLKGRESSRRESAGSNLVFLLDVSGSMSPPDKLPLLRSAMKLLVDQLDGRDQVAIVVYAGASGLVLPSTSGDRRQEIRDALDRLQAGGGTNGGEGLRLAYKVARENFIPAGVNRVILATDGDFNLGVTDQGQLLDLIEQDAKAGIFLTTLGFGEGNYKDSRLEKLSGRGNGNYAYIDSLSEARKVLVDEIGGTLVTIAKDVKIQVEFNPARVGAYRLLGYENRMLRKEDFNDDRKDAGEIGAGHTVTALYEIVPPGMERDLPQVDPLRYQVSRVPTEAAASSELLTLKLRYKVPDGDSSRLLSFPVVDEGLSLDAASENFKFAAAVAEFGMLLRDSEHKAGARFSQVQSLCLEGRGPDPAGYRDEFFRLVDRAAEIVGAD